MMFIFSTYIQSAEFLIYIYLLNFIYLIMCFQKVMGVARNRKFFNYTSHYLTLEILVVFRPCVCVCRFGSDDSQASPYHPNLMFTARKIIHPISSLFLGFPGLAAPLGGGSQFIANANHTTPISIFNWNICRYALHLINVMVSFKIVHWSLEVVAVDLFLVCFEILMTYNYTCYEWGACGCHIGHKS